MTDSPSCPAFRTSGESLPRKATRTGTYLFRHPRETARWLMDRFAVGDPISRGLPWFSWPSIRFLSGWLRPTYSVLEFGGGGSTVFFSARARRVVTIESDPAWQRRLEGLHLPNVRVIAGHAAHSVPDEHYDLVVVDGLLDDRLDCFHWAENHGYTIVLDDAWRWPDLPGERFTGPGPCRLGITQTLFYNPLK